MLRRLPNALTLARIVLTPAVGWLLARGDVKSAAVLLGIAAATDALDGWLARRWGAMTPLGAYLDPLADKLLAATVFLGLAASGRLPWWLAALVLGRDLMILGFALWALRFTRLRRFPPSVWGKLSTVLQFSLGLACLLHGLTESAWLAVAVKSLLPAVAAATAGSGMHYGWRASVLLRQAAD